MYCRPRSAQNVSRDLFSTKDYQRHRFDTAQSLGEAVKIHLTVPDGRSCLKSTSSNRPLYRHAYMTDVLSDVTFLEKLRQRRGSQKLSKSLQQFTALGQNPLKFLCETLPLTLEHEQGPYSLLYWQNKQIRNQRCRLKVEKSRKPVVSLKSITNNRWPMFPPRKELQPHIPIEKSTTGKSCEQREEKTSPSPVIESQTPEQQIKRPESPRKLSDQLTGQNVNRNHQAEQKSLVFHPHPPLNVAQPTLSYPRPYLRESAVLRTNPFATKRKPDIQRLMWTAIGNETADNFPFISESRPQASDPVSHTDEPCPHRSDHRLHMSDTCPLASPRSHLTMPRPQKSEPRLQGPITWPPHFPGDRHTHQGNAHLHIRQYLNDLNDTGSQTFHPFTLTNPWVMMHEPGPPLPKDPCPAKEEKLWYPSACNNQTERVTVTYQDGAYQTQTKGLESSEQSSMEESTSMDRVLSWLGTIPVTPSYPYLDRDDVSLVDVSRNDPLKTKAAHRASSFTVVKGVTAKLNRREATPVVRMSSPKKREVMIKSVCVNLKDTEYIDFCPCAPQTSPCSSIYRDLHKEVNVITPAAAPLHNNTEASTSKTKSLRSSKRHVFTPAPVKTLQITPQPSINVTFQRPPKLPVRTSVPQRREKALLRKSSRQFIITTPKVTTERLSVRSTSTPLVRRVRRARRRRGKKKRSKKCKADLKFLDKAIRVLKYNTTLLGRRPGPVELYDPDRTEFQSHRQFAVNVAVNGVHNTMSMKYVAARSLRSGSENGLYRPLTEQTKARYLEKAEWNLK